MDSYNFGLVWFLPELLALFGQGKKIDLSTRDMRLTFALGARRQNKIESNHTHQLHTHTQYTHQAYTLPRSQSSELGSPPFGFGLGFWLVFCCAHTLPWASEYRVIILLLFFSFFLFFSFYFILYFSLAFCCVSLCAGLALCEWFMLCFPAQPHRSQPQLWL